MFQSIITYNVLGRVHSLLQGEFSPECHLVLALSIFFTFFFFRLGRPVAGNFRHFLYNTAVLSELSNFFMSGVFKDVSFYGQNVWHHQHCNCLCSKVCNIFVYTVVSRQSAYFILLLPQYGHDGFYIHGSVHRKSTLIRSNKMQENAGIYLLQTHSTCFGCPLHPSSGVHKTVTAVSGTGHSNNIATTFLQRGL